MADVDNLPSEFDVTKPTQRWVSPNAPVPPSFLPYDMHHEAKDALNDHFVQRGWAISTDWGWS
jgi:hypothetical protein